MSAVSQFWDADSARSHSASTRGLPSEIAINQVLVRLPNNGVAAHSEPRERSVCTRTRHVRSFRHAMRSIVHLDSVIALASIYARTLRSLAVVFHINNSHCKVRILTRQATVVARKTREIKVPRFVIFMRKINTSSCLRHPSFRSLLGRSTPHLHNFLFYI